MTPKTALKKLGLTGTGTRDSLTINLEAGQTVTLNRADIPTWPQGKDLRKSTVVISGVAFQVAYAMDLMNTALEYFARTAAGV